MFSAALAVENLEEESQPPSRTPPWKAARCSPSAATTASSPGDQQLSVANSPMPIRALHSELASPGGDAGAPGDVGAPGECKCATIALVSACLPLSELANLNAGSR